ncbi:hypothetical protein J4205_00270 [Candidatus Pacearchaeota archaeon]|nr:hypothetical protein [Candidatus Pacearchaeota archaeon]
MKERLRDLEEISKALKGNDARLIENLGLNGFIEGLDSIVEYYKTTQDEDAKNSSVYDFAGIIYDMMKTIKDYRLDRGVENNIKANPINLRKEDLVFKSLFKMYNNLRFSFCTKTEEKEASNN